MAGVIGRVARWVNALVTCVNILYGMYPQIIERGICGRSALLRWRALRCETRRITNILYGIYVLRLAALVYVGVVLVRGVTGGERRASRVFRWNG